MKKVPRSNPELDLVSLFAGSPRHQKIAGYSDDAIASFGEDVVKQLGDVVSSETRVAGVRAEWIFRSVVTGLGAVQLIKDEDKGDTFYSGDELACPDFRIVLRDGQQMLVDVKRVEVKGNPNASFKLSDRRVQALRRYATLTHARLYFALFWEDMGFWTLNSLDAMEPGSTGERQWSILFVRAFATNEMAILGDRHIATAAPLSLPHSR